jgi:hypothetical protein
METGVTQSSRLKVMVSRSVRRSLRATGSVEEIFNVRVLYSWEYAVARVMSPFQESPDSLALVSRVAER